MTSAVILERGSEAGSVVGRLEVAFLRVHRSDGTRRWQQVRSPQPSRPLGCAGGGCGLGCREAAREKRRERSHLRVSSAQCSRDSDTKRDVQGCSVPVV